MSKGLNLHKAEADTDKLTTIEEMIKTRDRLIKMVNEIDAEIAFQGMKEELHSSKYLQAFPPHKSPYKSQGKKSTLMMLNESGQFNMPNNDGEIVARLALMAREKEIIKYEKKE